MGLCKDCPVSCNWDMKVSIFMTAYEKSLEEIDALDSSVFNNDQKSILKRKAFDRLQERKGALIKEIDPGCDNLKKV